MDRELLDQLEVPQPPYRMARPMAVLAAEPPVPPKPEPIPVSPAETPAPLPEEPLEIPPEDLELIVEQGIEEAAEGEVEKIDGAPPPPENATEEERKRLAGMAEEGKFRAKSAAAEGAAQVREAAGRKYETAEDYELEIARLNQIADQARAEGNMRKAKVAFEGAFYMGQQLAKMPRRAPEAAKPVEAPKAEPAQPAAASETLNEQISRLSKEAQAQLNKYKDKQDLGVKGEELLRAKQDVQEAQQRLEAAKRGEPMAEPAFDADRFAVVRDSDDVRRARAEAKAELERRQQAEPAEPAQAPAAQQQEEPAPFLELTEGERRQLKFAGKTQPEKNSQIGIDMNSAKKEDAARTATKEAQQQAREEERAAGEGMPSKPEVGNETVYIQPKGKTSEAVAPVPPTPVVETVELPDGSTARVEGYDAEGNPILNAQDLGATAEAEPIAKKKVKPTADELEAFQRQLRGEPAPAVTPTPTASEKRSAAARKGAATRAKNAQAAKIDRAEAEAIWEDGQRTEAGRERAELNEELRIQAEEALKVIDADPDTQEYMKRQGYVYGVDENGYFKDKDGKSTNVHATQIIGNKPAEAEALQRGNERVEALRAARRGEPVGGTSPEPAPEPEPAPPAPAERAPTPQEELDSAVAALRKAEEDERQAELGFKVYPTDQTRDELRDATERKFLAKRSLEEVQARFPGELTTEEAQRRQRSGEVVEVNVAELQARIAELEAQLAQPGGAGGEQPPQPPAERGGEARPEGEPEGPGEGEQALDELDAIEDLGDTSEPGWLEQQGARMEATRHDFWAYWWNVWAKRAKDSLGKRDKRIENLEKKSKKFAESSWIGTALNPLTYGSRIVWHKWRKGLLEAAQARHDARRVMHENYRNEVINDLIRRHRLPLRSYEAQLEKYAERSDAIDKDLDTADTMIKDLESRIIRERNPQRKAELLAERDIANDIYNEQVERKRETEEQWKGSVANANRLQSTIDQIAKYANLPSSETAPAERKGADTRQKRKPKQPLPKTA